MALPRVNTPVYDLELPSTGETIKYRPFLLKEQKTLMMAEESKDEKELMNVMGSLISSCTFDSVDPNTAPMFDIEYIFLKIRTKSVGSKVDLNVTCPDDGETKVPVTIDLDEIDVQMLEDHSNEVQIDEKIKITYRYPILKDMMNLSSSVTDIEKVFSVLNKCISSITFGDDVYQKSDITESEIENFIGELTTQQFEKLVAFFNSMPKLRHSIEITNPKTKVKSEVVVEGLQSFLG